MELRLERKRFSGPSNQHSFQILFQFALCFQRGSKYKSWHVLTEVIFFVMCYSMQFDLAGIKKQYFEWEISFIGWDVRHSSTRELSLIPGTNQFKLPWSLSSNIFSSLPMAGGFACQWLIIVYKPVQSLFYGIFNPWHGFGLITNQIKNSCSEKIFFISWSKLMKREIIKG